MFPELPPEITTFVLELVCQFDELCDQVFTLSAVACTCRRFRVEALQFLPHHLKRIPTYILSSLKSLKLGFAPLVLLHHFTQPVEWSQKYIIFLLEADGTCCATDHQFEKHFYWSPKTERLYWRPGVDTTQYHQPILYSSNTSLDTYISRQHLATAWVYKDQVYFIAPLQQNPVPIHKAYITNYLVSSLAAMLHTTPNHMCIRDLIGTWVVDGLYTSQKEHVIFVLDIIEPTTRYMAHRLNVKMSRTKIRRVKHVWNEELVKDLHLLSLVKKQLINTDAATRHQWRRQLTYQLLCDARCPSDTDTDNDDVSDRSSS